MSAIGAGGTQREAALLALVCAKPTHELLGYNFLKICLVNSSHSR